MLSRTKQLYLVTPAVYAAVIMGGGYGTGREVVEYFSRFGAGPGLLAIASSALAFFFILFSSFEVVRRTNQHDYRSFFKVILGRFWWLYEILYPLLFVLVIGVISASVVEISGQIISAACCEPSLSISCGLGNDTDWKEFYRRIFDRVDRLYVLCLCGISLGDVAGYSRSEPTGG